LFQNFEINSIFYWKPVQALKSARPDFAEMYSWVNIFCWSWNNIPIRKFYHNHIPTPKPNPTHKLSLKIRGQFQVNNTDLEALNSGCKPKLDINGKLVPQIWLVNWNVVPGSTKKSTFGRLVNWNVVPGSTFAEPAKCRFCLKNRRNVLYEWGSRNNLWSWILDQLQFM